MRRVPLVLLLGLSVALLAAGAAPTGAAGSAGAVARSPVRNFGGWCQARSSASWRRVLSHHIVPLSRTTPIRPMAVAKNGRTVFAAVYTPQFTGVAEVDAKTGAVTPIRAFPDPTPATGSEQGDQAWGAFDGRWLVWNEYRGETSFNDFTTWAWDSKTRKLTQIGAATQAPNGQFWESPWRGPDVQGGIATWTQGVGPDQLGEVHAYDLRTGRDLVVRRGHPNGSFLLAHHVVVWLEASAPGAPVLLHAASALTGKPLPLPRALRGLDNVIGLATNGSRIAYPLFSYKSLWWAPSLRSKPQEILATRPLNYVDNDVQVGRRYIGFGVQPHVYVADTRTHRYVQVSAHDGSTLIGSTSLIVGYSSGSKWNPVDPFALVPLRDLPPVPACH